MQIYVEDLYDIKFSSTMCHDTVSIYNTTINYFIFNCTTTSNFFMHFMHDTAYTYFHYISSNLKSSMLTYLTSGDMIQGKT
jgi:hypothetical protein